MLRNIGLASVWILPGLDPPDQLHHPAGFVRQYVAVQHIRAGEIHKLMPDADPSRHDLPVDGYARGNGNHVLPDLVRHRLYMLYVAPPALSMAGVSSSIT